MGMVIDQKLLKEGMEAAGRRQRMGSGGMLQKSDMNKEDARSREMEAYRSSQMSDWAKDVYRKIEDHVAGMSANGFFSSKNQDYILPFVGADGRGRAVGIVADSADSMRSALFYNVMRIDQSVQDGKYPSLDPSHMMFRAEYEAAMQPWAKIVYSSFGRHADKALLQDGTQAYGMAANGAGFDGYMPLCGSDADSLKFSMLCNLCAMEVDIRANGSATPSVNMESLSRHDWEWADTYARTDKDSMATFEKYAGWLRGCSVFDDGQPHTIVIPYVKEDDSVDSFQIDFDKGDLASLDGKALREIFMESYLDSHEPDMDPGDQLACLGGVNFMDPEEDWAFKRQIGSLEPVVPMPFNRDAAMMHVDKDVEAALDRYQWMMQNCGAIDGHDFLSHEFTIPCVLNSDSMSDVTLSLSGTEIQNLKPGELRELFMEQFNEGHDPNSNPGDQLRGICGVHFEDPGLNKAYNEYAESIRSMPSTVKGNLGYGEEDLNISLSGDKRCFIVHACPDGDDPTRITMGVQDGIHGKPYTAYVPECYQDLVRDSGLAAPVPGGQITAIEGQKCLPFEFNKEKLMALCPADVIRYDKNKDILPAKLPKNQREMSPAMEAYAENCAKQQGQSGPKLPGE